jgi:hypothetical protein
VTPQGHRRRRTSPAECHAFNAIWWAPALVRASLDHSRAPAGRGDPAGRCDAAAGASRRCALHRGNPNSRPIEPPGEGNQPERHPCVSSLSQRQSSQSPLCFQPRLRPRRSSAARSSRMANVGTAKSTHPRVRPRGDIGDRARKRRAVPRVEGERHHLGKRHRLRRRPRAVGSNVAMCGQAATPLSGGEAGGAPPDSLTQSRQKSLNRFGAKGRMCEKSGVLHRPARSALVEHRVETLAGQRIFGLALGYRTLSTQSPRIRACRHARIRWLHPRRCAR